MTKFTPLIHPWNQELWQSLTMEAERENHALLFTGGTGLGKKALAYSIAHFVLTENHSQSENLFNAGSHPDFHVLAPEYLVTDDLIGQFAQRYLESHSGKPRRSITIDAVRELGAVLHTHPHISKTRVVLILCAESLNRNAANGLLKNLEEPPANTLFLLVSDEAASLPKTIRSRCSLINFRAPEAAAAKTWLMQQNVLPEHEVDSHLAMANNHPLLALQLFEQDYISALKTVFTDVNGLWNSRVDAITTAKHWQELGAIKAVDILQKLSADLLRCSLQQSPKQVFFPVQLSWVQSIAKKVGRQAILNVMDELVYARKMLATTVDELLVLESVSNRFRQLPDSRQSTC